MSNRRRPRNQAANTAQALRNLTIRDAQQHSVRPTVTTKTSTYSIPARSNSGGGGAGGGWSPAYVKPSAGLNRTINTLRSNIKDDYTYSAFLGQMMEERYSSFYDRLQKKFTQQRDDYQTQIDEAMDRARDGKQYELPEMPKAGGLGANHGAQALMRQMAKDMERTKDPDAQENLARFYRYELERVQSLKNAYRDQRDSLSNTQHKAENYIGKQIKSGDFKAPTKGLSSKVTPENVTGSMFAGETGEVDATGKPKHSKLNWLSGPIGQQILDHSPADEFLKKIGGEGTDALNFAIDKLSRPLYAVNTAVDEYGALNNDPTQSRNFASKFFLHGGLSGIDPADSFDEFKDGGWKGVVNGAWEGFSGKKKTTFGHVIANEAERDKQNDIYDNKWYQQGVGLTGDLVYDPLNFVGAGVISKPFQISKGLKETYQIGKDARQIAETLDKAPKPFGPVERPLAKEEIADMLGANTRVYSKSDRRRNMIQINRNLDYLIGRINRADVAPDMTETARIKATAEALKERQASLVEDFGDSTLLESLARTAKLGNDAELDDLYLISNIDAGDLAESFREPALRHSAFEDAARTHFNTEATPYEVEGYSKTKNIARVDSTQGVNEGGNTFSDTAPDILATSGNRKRNIHVKDTAEKIRVGTKQSAWKNVLARRDNLNDLAAKGEIPQAEADAFAAKVSAVESTIDFKAIEDSLPSYITNDPRFENVDFEDLRRQAFAIANRDDTVRANQSASRAMSNLIKKTRNKIAGTSSAGKQKWLQEALNRQEARKEFLDGRQRLAQANAYINLLRQHIGEYTPPNADRIAELEAELAEVNSKLGKKMLGSDTKATVEKSARNDETGAAKDYDLVQHRKELKRQIKELKAVSSRPSSFEKFNDLPEEFTKVDAKTGEQTLDVAKLKQEINFKDESYGFNRRSIDPKLRGIRDILQENFEVTRDKIAKSGINKLREERDAGRITAEQYNNGYKRVLKDAAVDANERAWKTVEDKFNTNSLSRATYSDSIDLMRRPNDAEKVMIDEVKARQKSEIDELTASKLIANAEDAHAEVARINNQLADLRVKHKAEQDRVRASMVEAREAKREMTARLREEAIIRAAQLEATPFKKALTLNVLGRSLEIPGSQQLFAAADKANGIELIRSVRQGFADAFASPAGRLPEDMQLMRARAMANTPNIIARHVNALKHTMGQHRPEELNRTFKNMLYKGYSPDRGVDPVFDSINDAFQDLVPYFNNKIRVGDHTLSVEELNRYLPEEYRLKGKVGNIETPRNLMDAIKVGKDKNKIYKDPYRTAWNLRVAVEQAQSRAALVHSISSNFGIPRVRYRDNPDLNKIIERLHKQEGWQTIPDLGDAHLFHPEVTPDIKRLLDMMEPRNISQIGEVIDKATGIWKTATTIYNPGYWTRNGIGEIMSSWLGGVNTVAPYRHAAKVMQFARKDGQDLEALKSQFPMLAHVQSESPKGSQVLFKRANNEPVTVEQIEVLYNDQGLKTGFVNTEFNRQYGRISTAFRNNSATNLAMKGHDKLRGAGEWYEDYLRMAHFVDVIKKSNKPIAEAASDAAKAVRKYHFDYTDFTNFEKMAMLRAFPFYKWTRKAAPMMMTMLFTKPGKMMAYPKIMNATSNMLTTEDIEDDSNGFAPNYQGIVPGWMMDMWAYKIAESEDMSEEFPENNKTEGFFNMATPQMDSLKSIASPGSTGYTLLNPLFKVPVEQLQGFVGDEESGQTLKGLMTKADTTDYTNMNLALNSNDDKEIGNRIDEVLRQTPATGMLAKDNNAYTIASYLTGLGFYKNDDDRRRGEIMSRQGN